VAEGLAKAHGDRPAHGDIKDANTLLPAAEGEPRLRDVGPYVSRAAGPAYPRASPCLAPLALQSGARCAGSSGLRKPSEDLADAASLLSSPVLCLAAADADDPLPLRGPGDPGRFSGAASVQELRDLSVVEALAAQRGTLGKEHPGAMAAPFTAFISHPQATELEQREAVRTWAPAARVWQDLYEQPMAEGMRGGLSSASVAAAAAAAAAAATAFCGPAADSRLGELLIDALPLACANGFALDLHHVRFLCGATFRDGERRADGSLDRAGFLGGTADMISSSLRIQASWLAAARARKRENGGEERCSTQLYRASAAGDEQRVRELVAVGAPLRGAPCEGGWSALHRAAFSGHAGVVAALLDGRGAGLGIEVDLREANHMRRTALIIACEQAHEGVVRVLLARGASVGAQDVTGFCALHTAVLRGEASIVSLLCAAPGAAAAMALRARRSNGVAPGGLDDVVLTPLGFAMHWGGAAREACASVLRSAGAVV
jgi:hypothetical protein